MADFATALNITRDHVKTSPRWDPRKMIDEVYEKRLHQHDKWPSGGP